jgi:DNA-binding NtrC family response regulator
MNPDPPPSPGPLLGRSRATAELAEFLERAASVDAPVLLIGESGTGKSHVARLIHGRGHRAGKPLVSVNCAGVPDGLFEAEFFGQRKGAFTGASESRPGLFEQASGGTLFLDEVGELPAHQQAKLLAVLEDGLVRRVGGTRIRPVDVRIVAATCRNLEEVVAEGSFRLDLYHRLALLRCEIPPLRTRPSDLEPLVDHFLRRLARRHGFSRVTLTDDARRLLTDHSWPGNVRELSHVLEAALILAGSEHLDRTHFEPVIRTSAVASPPRGRNAANGAPEPHEAREEMARPARRRRYSFFGSDEDERKSILDALSHNEGNRTRTARELGMSRNTLRLRMRRYGL